MDGESVEYIALTKCNDSIHLPCKCQRANKHEDSERLLLNNQSKFRVLFAQKCKKCSQSINASHQCVSK